MLKERVEQVKPTIHAFGHIHECPGEQIENTHYINAAVVNRQYNYVYKPITIGFIKINNL
jgi:Icc-related predicted phosphoesterase